MRVLLREILSDISTGVGLATTALFAGPELMARAGWWPKPLLAALATFWIAIALLRAKTAKQFFEEAARGCQ